MRENVGTFRIWRQCSSSHHQQGGCGLFLRFNGRLDGDTRIIGSKFRHVVHLQHDVLDICIATNSKAHTCNFKDVRSKNTCFKLLCKTLVVAFVPNTNLSSHTGHIHTRTYIHTHIHVYMYIHAHTHTHINLNTYPYTYIEGNL